ncbi:MAG: hypothetical protein M3R24_42020 [Chloroflexota bacterium]|nr:hypothetical protein [Chloroflexota bacterium]
MVAPSIEAKQYGIKTGTRVKDAKLLCPDIVILPPDPAKYRDVHLRLKRILGRYTDVIAPKSIDEFVINLEGSPLLKRTDGTHYTARQIKARVKQEIGEWVCVRVGIAPNKFLAKTGAGLHKPDGLDEIHADNALAIYRSLELTDLCGIATRYAARLHQVGIFTVEDLYNSSVDRLRRGFRSIMGVHWYMWIRGWESGDVIFDRKSFGNSYSLPIQAATPTELAPILAKLVHKTAARMRTANYQCRGVHLSVVFRDYDYWHKGAKTEKPLFDQRDIYKEAYTLLERCPYRKPVKTLAVSVFNLSPYNVQQLSLFDDEEKKAKVTQAVDAVNQRFGTYCLTPGIMVGSEELVPDRIAFGGVKELQDYVFEDEEPPGI